MRRNQTVDLAALRDQLGVGRRGAMFERLTRFQSSFVSRLFSRLLLCRSLSVHGFLC
jgi:hypothetical protein